MLRPVCGWRLVAGAGLAWLLLGLLLTIRRQQGAEQGSRHAHWLGFSSREARLAQRVREGEDQVQWLKLQLASTQRRMSQGIKKREEEAGAETADCDRRPPPCEEIQVAVVCAGSEAVRTLVTLVKSILFHRRNPVHFHFISDAAARTILATLFETWRIPQVNVSLYPTEEVEGDVAWIPNKHYSGVFGLLKLTLPKILPQHLDRVIVLDTDVTFAADIGKLWTIFHKFSSGQALGLVENQSDWYIPGKLWKNHRPWPALGRGLNTGVILMKVARLRALGWSQTWRTVAESDLVTQLSTSLADQDVLNAVIKRQPALLYPLDCAWNVQMSDNSLSDSLCYDSRAGRVSVVHFNSPKKLQSTNKHISYFRNLHLTFLQYDGNLLRRELYSCQPEARAEDASVAAPDPEAAETSESPCLELTSDQSRVYRTHLNFLPDCLEAEAGLAEAVTLVAQLSLDRLPMLELLLAAWTGPASLALYLSDAEAETFLDFHSSSELLRGRCNVGWHVVHREGRHHPVNTLRQLALDQARSRYVFLSDVDFVPSPGSAETLRTSAAALLSDQTGPGPATRLLVVPAFESNQYLSSGRLPGTKAELVARLDLGEVAPFRWREWRRGHAPTNFPRWRTATLPYTVAWQQDFEPYIVGARAALPRYDTRFAGFGWNKVAHVLELEAGSPEWVVVPDVWTLHQPHGPSPDLAQFRGSPAYRGCVMRLKQEFIRELEARTGRRFYNATDTKDV